MHAMSPKVPLRSLILAALLGPSALSASPYGFLDQGAVRYFSAEDSRLMSDAINAALTQAADDETRTWRNDDSGNHGSVKALRTFRRDGMTCRRIEVRNHAKGIEDRSLADLCDVEGAWKVLSMPE